MLQAACTPDACLVHRPNLAVDAYCITNGMLYAAGVTAHHLLRSHQDSSKNGQEQLCLGTSVAGGSTQAAQLVHALCCMLHMLHIDIICTYSLCHSQNTHVSDNFTDAQALLLGL